MGGGRCARLGRRAADRATHLRRRLLRCSGASRERPRRGLGQCSGGVAAAAAVVRHAPPPNTSPRPARARPPSFSPSALTVGLVPAMPGGGKAPRRGGAASWEWRTAPHRALTVYRTHK